MQIKNLESWGYPLWFRFPIGLTEIALAAGLMIPRFRKMIIYGIFVWSIVGVITHLQAGQTNMIVGVTLFSVIAGALLLLMKGKTVNQTV